MRVGIIQSCYAPWRGYFDFINSVDLFVIYDDVQYSRGSWRNRNRLKTRNGLQWITVPVRAKLGDRIDEVEIGEFSGDGWRERHRQQLRDSLAGAHYYLEMYNLWDACVESPWVRLTDLNVGLTEALCGYLGIRVPLVRSSCYQLSGVKTERLINLLKAVGATTYLSGPSAKSYLDQALFREAGISLEYKTYDYIPYPQLWGPFERTVSVLDLIANCGPQAQQFIFSQTPNESVPL